VKDLVVVASWTLAGIAVYAMVLCYYVAVAGGYWK
jgi:hypothetical protein